MVRNSGLSSLSRGDLLGKGGEGTMWVLTVTGGMSSGHFGQTKLSCSKRQVEPGVALEPRDRPPGKSPSESLENHRTSPPVRVRCHPGPGRWARKVRKN